jgi:peptidoglycan/xylan/chitin deacetylase (PgdA/CDA1 family)
MSGGSVPILNYHRVRRDKEELQRCSADYYCITEQQLEQHLVFLRDGGFRTLLMEEFLSAGAVEKKSVILTFDDGHCSDLELAAPLLQRFGFRAVFFICIEYVGQPGYMSWEQIAQLQRLGMSVQSHGLRHHDLSQVEPGELVCELKRGREELEKYLACAVDYLALPGGFADSDVYAAAKQAGFKAVCNSEPGLAHKGERLRRIAVRSATTQQEFERYARRNRSDIALASLKYKSAARIKQVVGVGTYERLKTKLWL